MRAVRQRVTSVWRDTEGATAMIVALAISVIIGFGALGIEGSMWYAQSRNVHMAADTAALTGAVTYAAGDTTNFATEAKAIAATYGYVNNVGGVTVAVNHPPLTGPNTANQSAVEVIITTPQTPLIARLLHSANLTLYGRAVGAAGNS